MRRLLPLFLLPLPLLLVRAGFSGALPGSAFGEGWGRLYVAAQLRRWLSGAAPWGIADLCLDVQAHPFWPVDLLTSAGLAALLPLGDPMAMSLTLATLLTLAGVGAWAAARATGADPIGALVCGLGLQVHPFFLRNATDDVLEVVAVWPLPLGIAALLRALRAPTFGNCTLLGLAGWALGASNPYATVHAAIAGVVLTPWLVRRHGAGAMGRAVVALALGVGIAAAPLVLTETRAGGRLDPRYASVGFALSPGKRMFVEAEQLTERPPTGRAAGAPVTRPQPDRGPPAPRPPAAVATLSQIPGGFVTALGVLFGLFRPRSRPFALAAIAAFAVGPGPTRLLHLVSPSSPIRFDLLQSILAASPATATLGNPQRGIVLYIVAGWLCIAHLGKGGLSAALAACFEAWLSAPHLRIPSVDVRIEPRVLAALVGPTSTFPNGDPPIFHPGVPPKFALWLAGHHGHPTPSDYGRGAPPLDLGLQLAMSEQAGLPVSAHVGTPPPVDDQDVRNILVLYDFLSEPGRERVHAWLDQRYGPPRIDEAWGGVWSVPVTD